MLRFLARFIAVVCAIAFVVTAIGVLFFHAALTRLPRAELYKDALAKEGIYARLPALVAEGVAQAKQTGHLGELGGVEQLSPADWNIAFGAVLPAPYLQAQTESALDQFAEWMHSAAPAPVVKISLAELKRRLTAGEAETAYRRILEGKPLCTDEQMRAAGGFSLGCRPPPDQMPQVLDGFRKTMQTTAGNLPESADLFEKIKTDSGGAQVLQKLAKVRTRLARWERYAEWSPVIPVALLLLIAVFGVRSFRGWMLWWGVPCLIVGLVAVVFALPSASGARWVFSTIVLPRLPAEVPAAILDAAFGLMTAIVQGVLGGVLKHAGILAGGGLVAIILGAIFGPRAKPAGSA
jgi:hypothetical protein